jgi:hypothetical protein
MAKVTKQIQQLFLRLLNFTPELLNKTKEDALIRTAVEKHLRDLTVARERREAEQEQEAKEYATLRLRAHFAEDRNEFLTADDIRSWYK